MKTVKEISKITGISIRTLRYYDEINLLKPTKISNAGYRLYDQTALSRLQEILFFKELDLPLSTIKSMLDNPSYNRQQILQMQKSLLERKRNRLNGIIELINDAMEGVNTMNFEPFNEEDITKIINHSLELQSEENKKTIIEKYGSLEAFHEFVSANLKNEEQSSEVIKIYGSKDKAVEASLSATGNMDDFKEAQRTTDEIYHRFAHAMNTDDDKLAETCVIQLAENHKKMFHLDNARYLLIKMAEDYLSGGQLNDATDAQYGAGISKYIGKAIYKYYGI